MADPAHADGSPMDAARAYVGALERIVHAHRHALTEDDVRALAAGAARFRQAFYHGAADAAPAKPSDDFAERNALRAELRMSEASRDALRQELEASEAARHEAERRSEAMAAEASEARRRADMAEASFARGRLTREQLASCRAIQAAAGQLEALVPGVLGLARSAERGAGHDSVGACAHEVDAIDEALASASRDTAVG